MQQQQLNLLCCPECNTELHTRTDHSVNDVNQMLRCSSCAKDFTVHEHFIDFMGGQMLNYSGAWEKWIRTLYARMYTPLTNMMFLFCGGVKNAKREVLERLEIKDHQRVLETGVGAAENFYLLSRKAGNLKFYGNDIQKQMLMHAVRNLSKWQIPANLYRADAQCLPFKDASFDVVFHLGSINLFPDKKQAIDEMLLNK